ncbi:1-aminocyclopropane-1-carboxylate deaminase [Pedobacter sp. HMWF019]|uniref:1-aminocyclopropane-1-carboxylate deaminase/D-cysteine desulfhydrase n=1 Tax=Pedobacter sp. HMWF019 TaxID=2056856 RepID=UPI000D371929|nr:pyridoxal-phosphate dependent enzyme [Pedobacter sp. HMWF019]PTT01233.1 1-aminocyclopropane-1-carboxylate deaminase [Pedobacter sp. HMWF019]
MFEAIHSPLHKLKHPSSVQLYVKRDDLIDPYISGNKWRKLKYILAKALDLKRTHLVTFGGAYSNHLIATAAAAARSGLQSTGFVRGEEVENDTLFLCKLYGMKLIFISREAYKDKFGLFKVFFGEDPSAYFIDEGGASAEAVRGCAEIIQELPGDVDHLFCAAGTGTTAAGLLKGIRQQNLKTQLHVIPVLKGGDFIAGEIYNYTKTIEQLNLHTDYHFGGYAKTSPELLQFMTGFAAREGMLIDPIYTAKMFYAIDDLAKQGYFNPGEKIVALHTGGLLGILGKKQQLSASISSPGNL